MDKRFILGLSIGAGFGAGIAVRRFRTWGIERDEAERPLPGDDVVDEGETLLTRGITIDAPPDAVWPWLVQMGYGRGGWYSYDQLDMKGRSAETPLPEFQSLEVGDVVPTHPGGGFVVRLAICTRRSSSISTASLPMARRAPRGSTLTRSRPRDSRRRVSSSGRRPHRTSR